MRFSIIIPIYNAEKTLSRCLNSVREQYYDDFEVIMVNDGSSDRSENICLDFQRIDKRFKYIYQENKGVSAARNTGIDNSSFELITFLDSDDAYFPNYLSSFIKLMKEYPEAGHYWCAFSEYNKEGFGTGKIYCYSKDESISILDRSKIMDLHECILDSSPWNKVFKRSILGSLRMKPELSLGEDLLFNLEYLNNHPSTTIVVNNVPQYGYYVMSQNSLDHKYRNDLFDIFNLLLEELRTYLTKWDLADMQWKKYYNTSFFMYEQVLKNTFREENSVSKKGKIQFNNRIMQSIEFKHILNEINCYVNPLYKAAYKTGNYQYILLCDRLLALKKLILLNNKR